MIFENGIALIADGSVAISFAGPQTAASKKAEAKPKASFVLPQEMRTDLKVAFWGGDNLYPQRVTEQLSTCGVARSALDFKAKMLFGHGIVYGKVTGVDKKGNEIFTPAKPGEHPAIDDFFRENDNFYRFFLEFNQDWVQYGNCFPELIFSKDHKRIARIVHQESSDCRFKQMNAKGVIDTVYFSKFWAGYEQQFVKSSKDDKLKVGANGAKKLPKDKADEDVVKTLRSIDMYNALEGLELAVKEDIDSVILPVNYPSTGKTYYQSPVWDAVILSGWLEIASNIPAMLKLLYSKAFNIKYHIEVPDNYFSKNAENWGDLDDVERLNIKKSFINDLEKFLSGTENGYKSLVTFFDVDPITKKDYGSVKITAIDNKSTVDKDLLLSSAANQEILFALQINPNLIGAGAPGGAYTGGAGSGSDIREAFLVYNSLLHLEQQIILEPIKLAAKFNGFDPDVVFRFKHIVLTTLDKNSGTEKVVS